MTEPTGNRSARGVGGRPRFRVRADRRGSRIPLLLRGGETLGYPSAATGSLARRRPRDDRLRVCGTGGIGVAERHVAPVGAGRAARSGKGPSEGNGRCFFLSHYLSLCFSPSERDDACVRACERDRPARSTPGN